MFHNSRMNMTTETQRHRVERVRAFVLFWFISVFCGAGILHAEEQRVAAFKRVFGDLVELDPTTVEKVKALPPGERLLIDRNNDGLHDEVWFIDTAARHQEKNRPILVRVIDEDGDLDAHLGPDLDSDLYIADWHADGIADVVLDYQDNDADDDLDEMAFYFWLPQHRYFGENALGVWWGRDDGDDNQLWYDLDYTYYQHLCQYRCHLSGDEAFVAFGLSANGDHWISGWENPFLFYDPDADGCSEVVLRVEGLDDEVRAIRYSFDADDDAVGRHTHDYDFSICAVSGKDDPVRLKQENVSGMRLRGIPTQRWLQRDPAQDFARHANWERVVLTWDELNANTDGDFDRDPNERWEGVIARKSDHFPQIGGPPVSEFNKRNEVSLKPITPLRLYYDPSDRRLHLRGATEGWIKVDYNLDGQLDATYTYIDDNQDGVWDRRLIDLDADGKPEFDWPMHGPRGDDYDLSFESLTRSGERSWRQITAGALYDTPPFIDAAREVLGSDVGDASAIAAFFLNEVEHWQRAARLGERIRSTPAGARYYMDLVRDQLLWEVRTQHGNNAQWVAIEATYALGDFRRAAELVKRLTDHPPLNPKRFGDYAYRVPIRITNPTDTVRADWPVSIPMAQLQDHSPDFNPANYTVVAPQRWIDWRVVPHQSFEVYADIGRELNFLVDVPADDGVTYYVYYSPVERHNKLFIAKTGTAEDWVPPNIGWESNRIGYRAYWGQWDFFGKKIDGLIYGDIGGKNYHDETDWGIDALLTGPTSGCGGLTLYVDGEAYPVQNPAGEGNIKFTKRVICTGPVRCAIEWTARNIVPDQPDLSVTTTASIYAERAETEVTVTVAGGKGDILIAPGFIKLDREQTFADRDTGCFGAWGFQAAVIDEIGLGLIAEPGAFIGIDEAEKERRYQLRPSADGTLRYWIVADWRRGRQYPVAPTAENWRNEVLDLGESLLNPADVSIWRPEAFEY